MYLQLHILRLQYSNERISAVIGHITTIQCALYCKHGAKYSAHPPVYAVWTVVQDIYNIFTASIFRLQYSTKPSSAAIGDMSTIQRAIYCKHGAKYSAHPPVYAIWTVVAATNSLITAPHIQASIFN
jgi:hypothetical protein